MPTPTTTVEFQNIPLSLIIIEKQIRTGADVDDEASQGLKDSIAAKGVLEPVLVTPQGEKYRLLAGERRYRTCRQLGLETIPARILPNIQPGEEVLTIQLMDLVVTRRAETLERLCSFLSLPVDEEMVQWFDANVTPEGAHPGRWRRDFDEATCLRIDAVYAESVERLQAAGVDIPG